MQAIRRRCRRDEEGFTLIELMVVVLIIAILMAIAIPTFLGARTRAQDRGAQADVKNALTSAATLFTDSQNYSSVTVAGLTSAEPNLSFVAAMPGSGDTTNTVVVSTSAAGTTPANSWITFEVQSASGTCWGASQPANAATVYFGKASTTCAATTAVGEPSGWSHGATYSDVTP
ncbi:MAG: type II secretion system protein [Acidimicrobiales bacterium]